MDPIALAHWICGDGQKRDYGLVLCTDSFTLIEVELLIDALNKNFNLKCYKCRYKNNYSAAPYFFFDLKIKKKIEALIIPSYSISTLQNLIAIHMPPIIKYKMNL